MCLVYFRNTIFPIILMWHVFVSMYRLFWFIITLLTFLKVLCKLLALTMFHEPAYG